MATLINLIDEHAGFLTATTSGTGKWVVSGGSLRRTSQRKKTGQVSLLATASTSTMTLHSSTVDEAEQITGGRVYRPISWSHHSTIGRELSVGIEYFDIAKTLIATDSQTFTQGFDEWTLEYFDSTAPAGAHYARLVITLADVDTSTPDKYLWLDDICLVDYGRLSSRFLDLFSRWIPEWLIELDYQQSTPQWPMMRFVDLIGFQMDEVYDLISDFDYVPVAEGGPVGDTSSLVDPANYVDTASTMTSKPEWLPWLAQHIGVRNTSLSLNDSTGWTYLEANYPTWSDWENAINAASTAALSISAVSRSGATTTITTTSNHGLEAGDSVTVAGTTVTSGTTADVGFNGIFEVLTASGSSLSYSQQFGLVSISRPNASSTVTVITGRPHGFVSGNTVTISGTGFVDFDTTVTVVAVSTSNDDGVDAFTFTTVATSAQTAYVGTVVPATNKSGTSGTVTPADLAWSFIEQLNSENVDPRSNFAQFTRTGASGLWAGTGEGMRRAARICLNGTDLAASATSGDGDITFTTASPHGFSAGDTIVVYGAPEPALNRAWVIDSVGSQTTFTSTSSNPAVFSSVDCRVTDKSVTITPGYWNGKIDTVVVGSANSVTLNLLEPVPATSLTGTVVISGSASSAVNVTHSPVGSITVAADRMSVTFTSNQTLSPQSSLGGKAKVAVDASCFVVGTITSQTPGDQTVIDFVGKAKPAGGIITHEYTG